MRACARLAQRAKLARMDEATQDRRLALAEAEAAARARIAEPLRRRAAPLLVGAAMLWLRVAAVLALSTPLLFLLWVLARG